MSAAALQRVERVAHSLHGKTASVHALAEAVKAVSQVYTRERAQMPGLAGVASDAAAVMLARAGFFFPRDLVKPFGPLDELARFGRMPQKSKLRVLDVGAGLGATSFGLARWLRLRGQRVDKLSVLALEQSAPALRGFTAFTRALGELPNEFVPLELEARAEDLTSARLPADFDVVLLGFVLNELFVGAPDAVQRRAELVLQAAARLAPGGALIILEPALKATTRELMQLRDLLVAREKAPFVLAPCLHARPCPMLPSERDWCHQELAYALPKTLTEVAKSAGLRFEGLSYASLVLVNEALPSTDSRYRVVSDRLASKGKLELIGCGPSYTRFVRLDRNASAHNEAFGEAQRGSVLSIEGAGPRIERDTVVRRV